MKRAVIAIGMAFLTLGTTALAENSPQFDLQCDGNKQTQDGREPVTVHVRVDLDRREWCRDDCQFTDQIEEVTSVMIVFKDDPGIIINDDNSDATPTMDYFGVSRSSGTWAEQLWHPYQGIWLAGGTCVAGPFSGFPERPAILF